MASSRASLSAPSSKIPEGQRAGLLSNHRNRLPGRHSPQAAARLGGRTARPFRPALGRGQARTAVGPAHSERASGRPADRGARRQHPALLEQRMNAVLGALAGIATVEPASFSTDPDTCEMYWKVRKGAFPSVGAMRRAGTTVIIEDVAFPVESLAAATLDLQALLRHHGYSEGIHLWPCARRQPPLRLHPGLQRPRRGRSLRALHG